MTTKATKPNQKRRSDLEVVNQCILTLHKGGDQRMLFQVFAACVAALLWFIALSALPFSLGGVVSVLGFVVMVITYWAVGKYSKWPRTTFQRLVDTFERYEPIDAVHYNELMKKVATGRPVFLSEWFLWVETEEFALRELEHPQAHFKPQNAEGH